MKREVVKWQNGPDVMTSPLITARTDGSSELGKALDAAADAEATSPGEGGGSLSLGHTRSRSVDKIPLLDREGAATGLDGGAKDVARERKIGELPP